MKNCGQTVHDEVANKQTMEELKELLKVGTRSREVVPVPCQSLPGRVWGRAAGPSSCRVREGVPGQGWELSLEGQGTHTWLGRVLSRRRVSVGE